MKNATATLGRHLNRNRNAQGDGRISEKASPCSKRNSAPNLKDNTRLTRASTAAPANDASDRLIARGNEAEKDGKLGEACELYRKAVQAAPGYAKAHLNLGIGLEATGDFDGAVEQYEAALLIDAADTYANYNLAKLLYARG